MKKVLPILLAAVLFVLTWLGVDVFTKHSIAEKRTDLAYFNSDLRNFSKDAMGAVLSENAIPVFGSSELSAADDIAYPPVLFHNGHSDFNMVLMGRGYMQSLHHAISAGALSDVIPQKKVVLILSPQWFETSFLSSVMYASRFSEQLYIEFLKNPKITDETKQQVADRLKQLLEEDPKMLSRVEKYEAVYLGGSHDPLLRLETSLFERFLDVRQNYLLTRSISRQEENTESWVRADDIDFDGLLEQAEQTGSAACTNNDFGVNDEYFTTYLEDDLSQYADSRSGDSLQMSLEYYDLRLFLQVCRETGLDALVVCIPVNGRWYDFTGLTEERRDAYYQTVRDICAQYGAQLADFSDSEYELYFLKDVMHLGWKGWVRLDEAVYAFYKQP